jgi:hypothetical protein
VKASSATKVVVLKLMDWPPMTRHHEESQGGGADLDEVQAVQRQVSSCLLA